MNEKGRPQHSGVVTITLTNLDPDRAEEVEICAGVPVQEAKGRILQGKVDRAKYV